MSDEECGCRASNHYCGVMEGHCKYAALKASHAELAQMLTLFKDYGLAEIPSTPASLRPMLEGMVLAALAALKKAEGLK